MAKKAETLALWKGLAPTNPLPHMEPIPYKARGSRYGACGIRIDGSPEFIDAVLSNLKTLLDGENQVTRLALARNPVDAVTINGEHKGFTNRARAAEVCYVRLHMRGHEGAMVQGLTGANRQATERFAKTSIFAQ